MNLLISCEVGGSLVPAAFAEATCGAEHSSQDPPRAPAGPIDQTTPFAAGDRVAGEVARRLAAHTDARLIENPYSPALIDVSRSLHHRRLFSSRTRTWPAALRKQLVEVIYRPYRQRIRAEIERCLRPRKPLVHLSVRTFDAFYGDRPRRADMGLSYDATAKAEREFCLDWMDWMYDDVPMLRVRRNYPRRGTHDSLTRTMRREYRDRGYLGIEVLLNRHWAQRRVALREETIDGIGWSLQAVTEEQWAEAA